MYRILHQTADELGTTRLVSLILVGGVMLRIAAWGILPPIWKLHAVFNPLDLPVTSYVADFRGYKPSRVPFFDVFSAWVYVPFRGVLGFRALTLLHC